MPEQWFENAPDGTAARLGLKRMQPTSASSGVQSTATLRWRFNGTKRCCVRVACS